MGRMLTAALVGAIIVFVWGFVSWVVLPWHWWAMAPMPNDAAVAEVLKSGIKESGLYLSPAPPHFADRAATQDEEKAWRDKHEKGPLVRVFYRKTGSTPMDPMILAKGIGIAFGGALVAAVMLNMGARAGCTYVSRFMIVLLMGVFAVITTHFMEWNYWQTEDLYTMIQAADTLAGWVLAGLAMAWIVNPKAA